MLTRHELPLEREEAERVDTLRYTWKKLLTQAGQVQGALLKVQPMFRQNLLENVAIFKQDCLVFYDDYGQVSFSIREHLCKIVYFPEFSNMYIISLN